MGGLYLSKIYDLIAQHNYYSPFHILQIFLFWRSNSKALDLQQKFCVENVECCKIESTGKKNKSKLYALIGKDPHQERSFSISLKSFITHLPRKTNQADLNLCGKTLMQVKNFEYLGVTFRYISKSSDL